MNIEISEQEDKFLESLSALQEAPGFARREKLERLLSNVDMLCRKPEGIAFLYEKIADLLKADIFSGTAWVSPNNLVPSLVGGTLMAGHPTSTLELLSELRMLALALGKGTVLNMTPMQARQFLEEALVKNFELLFEDFSEPVWENYSVGEIRKIRLLFDFLLTHIPVQSLKGRIHDEVETLIAHRPVVAGKLEKMLYVIDQRVELDESQPVDRHLIRYVRALLRPTPHARRYPDLKEYEERMKTLSKPTLEKEARMMGETLAGPGLVSEHHLILIRVLTQTFPVYIPFALHLDSHGRAEFERHQAFVLMLIQEFLVPANRKAVYGLANVLERNLFSRPITWNAFNRLLRIKIHPQVAEDLLKSNHTNYEATPQQLLIGGVINVLGHPLGVRQGNNPTCQSARGISMWSRHAPGKLINLLIDAAVAHNVSFRYEGELFESAKIEEGLVRRFDYKLDPVSVVLVPHLDKIYNQMMQRAALKHVGKDPHISVNPAFYGQWIQTGFISVYNPVTGAIDSYEEFIRIFYASFHPEYNGGHHLAYPVPLGIFITDTSGTMMGYHAVSLLRVKKDPGGKWRAYFFNPNSEGRQNWGQKIEPSVAGRGEEPGESSLPVHEFASRVYAYHYNNIRLGDKTKKVTGAIVRKITVLAKESWGRKYSWL